MPNLAVVGSFDAGMEHGYQLVHANTRDIRKFLKQDSHENSRGSQNNKSE